MMDHLLMVALGVIFLYYIIQFIRVLWKMQEHVIFPVREEQFSSIWIQTNKPVSKPTYQGQRNGIIFYSLFFIWIIMICYFVWRFYPNPSVMGYLLAIFPLLYTRKLLNLFVVTKNGIIIGTRFISWRRMTSYDIIKIDINHKYYGHSPEINDEYEIKIHSKIFTYSCIVTSEEAREKLVTLLQDRGIEEKVNDLKNIVDMKEEPNQSI